jgi:hypothetical protein
MNKAIIQLKRGFESSSGTTPEFVSFFRTFKKELTAFLTSKGCTKVELHRGHFYVYGFFTAPSGQIYYISIPDVRGSEIRIPDLLYRTAKSHKDFTGGVNQYAQLDNLEQTLRITGRFGIATE